MSNIDQQWESIVLRKDKKQEPVKHVEGFKKKTVLYSDEPEAPKVISLSAAKQIQNARAAQKMTQEQLAQKICVKKNIIQDYESGKVVPDRTILNRLNRALNIKIEL